MYDVVTGKGVGIRHKGLPREVYGSRASGE